jgi:hypothetical protein
MIGVFPAVSCLSSRPLSRAGRPVFNSMKLEGRYNWATEPDLSHSRLQRDGEALSTSVVSSTNRSVIPTLSSWID